MRLRLAPVLYSLLGLLLVWSVASWFIAKTSRHQFDVALEALATGPAKNFFELELVDYQERYYAATVELSVIPTSGLIDENIEHSKVFLHRSNGPVLINRDGVQFGLARWELMIEENDPDASDETLMQSSGLFLGLQPIASVDVGFLENIQVSFERPVKSLLNWSFESLAIKGSIDFASAQHQISMEVANARYQDAPFSVAFSKGRLISETSENTAFDNGSISENLTKLSINVDGGELVPLDQSKKIPFNLQSHGSIWLINDTLSSDWQFTMASGDKLGIGGVGKAQELGYFQTDANLQVRELFASGFWQYLNNQSEVFSLLQQAEWAMEDIETPEQQDFLRSLFLDAERIKQSQLDNPLKPLLITERSQLAANISVSRGDKSISSQLSLGGSAIAKAKQPQLALKGELTVKREMLSKNGLAVLDRWHRKQWFRRYEAEYESDITVRDGRLMLNNLIMSVDRLSAELSHALTDQ